MFPIKAFGNCKKDVASKRLYANYYSQATRISQRAIFQLNL